MVLTGSTVFNAPGQRNSTQVKAGRRSAGALPLLPATDSQERAQRRRDEG